MKRTGSFTSRTSEHVLGCCEKDLVEFSWVSAAMAFLVEPSRQI
jgi:hypothetical protein